MSPTIPAGDSALEQAQVLENDAYARAPRSTGLFARPLVRSLAVFWLLSMLAGGVGGALWNLVVPLPSYHVDANGNATTSERGLALVFASDAVFCLVGAVVGLGIGLCAWRWFRRLGWPVCLVAMGGGLLGALLCWWVGTLMGPHDFAARIAQAGAGAVVPIDFQLHSLVALLVWPFFAIIPVLFASAMSRDEDLAETVPPAAVEAPGTPVPPPAR
ncbi:hypothetical protein GCM10027030_31710 [Luteococcus sediminum]